MNLKTRITILTGSYGSGKTELSLNLALSTALKEKITLVDLDIVNPYFRSSEKKSMLEEAGVNVLSPTFANTNVDIPVLPAEIVSVFCNKAQKVIFDVGGDDSGAVALGRYHDYIMRDDCEMLLVVNAFRPFTSNAEDIAELAALITARARMPISGIINNSNIGLLTDEESIKHGQSVVKSAAELLNTEVRYTLVDNTVAEKLPFELRQSLTKIQTYMRPEWM